MPHPSAQQNREGYREQQLATVTPILKELGFALQAQQPHLGGERYLMQAVTTASGRKLILLGYRVSDNTRVVIKATGDPEGMRELEHERSCREILHEIGFAYKIFRSPEEILFKHTRGFLISVQAFISQEKPFLARDLKEQFSLALTAFKAQESAHATTYKHLRLIRHTFGSMNAGDYLRLFARMSENLRARDLLEKHRETIEQYCGFLTHVDFVPHNFRIAHGEIFLLDHSSLRFGNKYEGWARFLNFMTLYNPALEKALTKYIALNRTPEESLSLRLMRIYRLGEIIWYYRDKLPHSRGNLYTLNSKRVEFWSTVLDAMLEDREVPEATIAEYRRVRDSLRSPEERERQVDLH